MVNSKAVPFSLLQCEHCEAEVYTCDGCDGYFNEDQDISCKGEKHYHLECVPESKEE